MVMNVLLRKMPLLMCLMVLAVPVSAEVIVLKSGERISGIIIERGDDFIKVDRGLGLGLTYYMDQIQEIVEDAPVREQPEPAASEEPAPVPMPAVMAEEVAPPVAAILEEGPPEQAPVVRKRGPLNVLFIGNNLTTANDLPQMVQRMSVGRGQPMVVEIHAPSDYSFERHVVDNTLMQLIQSKSWDYVILQEQSQRPAFSQSQVATEVYGNAKLLVQRIRDRHPQAQIIFYETMARMNGDAGNAHVTRELTTYEGMQARVSAAYQEMATSNKAMLARVGTVWQKFREQFPDVNLYADAIHPNSLGSYLAACVIYQQITGEKATATTIPANINKVQGEAIQNLAAEEMR